MKAILFYYLAGVCLGFVLGFITLAVMIAGS